MFFLRRRIKGWDRDSRGQALVEMALVLPLLLLLLLGLVEFGRIFNAHLVLTAASREGARAAAVGRPDSEVEEAVRAAAELYDGPALGVEIDPAAGNRSRGDPVEVRSDLNLQLITPLFSQLLPNPFPVQGATTMRVE